MQIIKKCWTAEVFDWEGKHYHLKGVRAMPKPVQKPHPPIFMPARNPRAMERNAREGYGANQGAGRWTLEQTDPGWWRQWHKEWEAALARHDRTAQECPVSVFFNLFCTNDPERAWATYRDGILHVTHAYAMLSEQPLLPETPDQMVRFLRDILEGAAPDHLLLWDTKPGMTYEDAYAFHKLFAEEVWPQIKDLT